MFIHHLSIRTKHTFILILVVLGLIITSALTVLQFSQLGDLGDILYQQEKVNSEMLMLRRNEKDFLARKALKYATQFEQHANQADAHLTQLKTDMSSMNLNTGRIDGLADNIREYRQVFAELVRQQTDVGLDHKSGLYGALREAVHNVEATAKAAADYEILYYMLMLRRHEKDFMLRSDAKYMEKFNQGISDFRAALTTSPLAGDSQVRTQLQTYQDDFSALFAKEQLIGLNEDEGLRGKMRAAVRQTESGFDALSTYISEQMASKRQTVYTNLVISILVTFLIVSALTILVSRAIYRPVQEITAQIQHIAGDLDLTRMTEHPSGDEIGLLSRAFDSLISTLRNTVDQVKSGAGEVAAASEEMSVITREVGNASQLQQDEVTQTVTAMNEMTSTIQNIAGNANEAASAVSQVHQQVSHGKQISDQARSEMEQLNEEILQATHAIEKLQQDSASIGAILNEINAIAEQTNLLALNAAIEAARAGEQGRGFAVVADEVRTLAQRTQESTESISSTISEFNKGTADVVNTVLKSRDRADSGISKVREASAALQVIYDEVTNISDLNNQMATAAEEQSYAADEINRNVVRVNDLADTSRQQAAQAAAASQALAELAARLSDTVEKFTVS
ncbi:MAG: methyl-accepting chemotaxis protein [Pseudomonadota bacterium]|nr:methyl-accepting chemotaxis protein [Pseudomonadota bacterium]